MFCPVLVIRSFTCKINAACLFIAILQIFLQCDLHRENVLHSESFELSIRQNIVNRIAYCTVEVRAFAMLNDEGFMGGFHMSYFRCCGYFDHTLVTFLPNLYFTRLSNCFHNAEFPYCFNQLSTAIFMPQKNAVRRLQRNS